MKHIPRNLAECVTELERKVGEISPVGETDLQRLAHLYRKWDEEKKGVHRVKPHHPYEENDYLFFLRMAKNDQLFEAMSALLEEMKQKERGES